MAGIWRQIDAGITQPGPDGRTPRQLLETLSKRIHDLAARQHRKFHHPRAPAEAEGIAILDPRNLDEAQGAFALDYFERSLLPLITPLAVDTGHPFPRLGNRALVLVVELVPDEDLLDGDLPASDLSFIHVPTGLASRFLRVPSAPGTHAFMMLEDVVRHHLSRLFLGYQIKSCHAIRVTRDSDLPVEEDPSEDLLKTVEESLRDRRRGAVVASSTNRACPPRCWTCSSRRWS